MITSTSRQLQHLSPERAARDAEGVADLLRVLGPLTEPEVADRCTVTDVGGWLEGLWAAKRALTASFAGQTWWVAVEDIDLLRDGVGVAVPVGIPASFTASVTDPLGELLGHARTHGPFTTAAAAARFGLVVRVTADVLGRLAIDGRLVRGEFTDAADGDQWCDADVLKNLRRRSLAALRAQVEPVSTAAYARFLPAWQHVGSTHGSGIDGLASVIDQLAGVPIPASAVAPLVCGQRVRDYQPAMLDELLAVGEVTWSGAGPIGGGDGWSRSTPPIGAADARPDRRDRVHRCPPRHPGHPERRRGLLLPSARRGEFQTLQTGAVGTDLGWLGHRRHVRSGPRNAVRHPPFGRTASGHARTSAAPTAAPAEPLQRRARAGPQLRTRPLPDAGRRCPPPNRTPR